MKNLYNKTLGSLLVFLFITLSLSPIVSSIEKIELKNNQLQSSGEDVELDLLHGEYYLYFDANENVSSFNIRYSFPPEYGYQIPILIELLEDTTADILDYKIENDTNEPNKVVNFTIGPMNKGDRDRIHFNYWVLVKNHDYSDLPDKVKIPKKDELPPETTKWLSSTEVVQADNLRINFRAKLMKLFNSDMLKLANRIVKFTKSHRYLFFRIQLYTGLFKSQDALTTLRRNGECPGRSHLGCALFRANDIPARVILANPSYNFPYEMHYMIEYFLYDYGWVLTEVHNGITPYEPKKQIILRVCYPDDENNTQTDFIYPRMTGIESWFWINNENISPFYDPFNLFVFDKEGSKIRMFNEKQIVIDSIIADDVLNLTKNVFHQFEYYLGLGLTGENLNYFNNATSYQMEAIRCLKGSEYCLGYYYGYMIKANEEYNKINI